MGLPMLLRLLLVLGADGEVREAVVKVALPSLKHGKEYMYAQPSAEPRTENDEGLECQASIVLLDSRARTVHRESHAMCQVDERRKGCGPPAARRVASRWPARCRGCGVPRGTPDAPAAARPANPPPAQQVIVAVSSWWLRDSPERAFSSCNMIPKIALELCVRSLC